MTFYNFVIKQLKKTIDELGTSEIFTPHNMYLITKRNLFREFLNQLSNKLTNKKVDLTRIKILIKIQKYQSAKLNTPKKYLSCIENVSSNYICGEKLS